MKIPWAYVQNIPRSTRADPTQKIHTSATKSTTKTHFMRLLMLSPWLYPNGGCLEQTLVVNILNINIGNVWHRFGTNP